MAASTSSAISRNCPKASPSLQAVRKLYSPRPASPPSMAAHGFFGSNRRRGVDSGRLGGSRCVLCRLRPHAGAAALRCVTLPDCLPIGATTPQTLGLRQRACEHDSAHQYERHEFHASLSMLVLVPTRSTLDSNVQCDHSGRTVVAIHMTETTLLHQAPEFFLSGVHANGLRQVAIA